MLKMKSKRILSLLLILVMCAALLPGVALATDRPTTEEGDYYIPVDGTKGLEAINNDIWKGNSSNNGVVYGWGIRGVTVIEHEMDEPTTIGLDASKNSELGAIYDKTYNITLDSGTDPDTPFTLVCDAASTGSNSSYPCILDDFNYAASNNNQKIEDNFVISKLCLVPITLSELIESDGVFTKCLYVVNRAVSSPSGNPVTYTFNFSIAAPDVSSDPDSADVDSIYIQTSPNKTTYIDGTKFSRIGMVVLANLPGGGDSVEIKGYTVEPETLMLGTTQVTVRFGTHTATQAVTVLPSTAIANVEILNGQLLSDLKLKLSTGVGNTYEKKVDAYDAVVLYGQQKGIVRFDVSDGAKVFIGANGQPVTDGLCELQLDTSAAGSTSIVRIEGSCNSREFTFTCYSQQFSGMPAEVVDYLCIASQYTNGAHYVGDVGLNAVGTIRGTSSPGTTPYDGLNSGPTSLGNFGGYITYRFDEPIKNDPNNPYGIDFIVYGNSYNGTAGFAEPGNVLVSETGADGTWYTLAGSLHFDNSAIWSYKMTYTRQSGMSRWEDEYGNSGIGDKYPVPTYYPLFNWTPALETRIALTGTLLTAETATNEYGNTVPPFAHFGYADIGIMGSSNVASNPYTGLEMVGGALTVNRTDGFDLLWAVDETGMPVNVDGKEFHYVKIQTATNINSGGGGIGEKSTEVHMVRVAESSGSNVGVTTAPTMIKVAGKNVDVFTGGTYIYNNVSVPETGAFVVEVTAADGANVYINSTRGTSATFANKPAHDIIRIIVQEGETAPVIYYLNTKADSSLQRLRL